MQGIVPGRNIVARMANPSFWANAKAGTHNAPLNAFLGRAVEAVRRVYHGPLSYASLVWEAVDWSRFDIVGVDHYRDPRINDRYVEMLASLFATGKPVVVTEFGCRTFQGAESAGRHRQFRHGRQPFALPPRAPARGPARAASPGRRRTCETKRCRLTN